jgi:hypothetical protein
MPNWCDVFIFMIVMLWSAKDLWLFVCLFGLFVCLNTTIFMIFFTVYVVCGCEERASIYLFLSRVQLKDIFALKA